MEKTETFESFPAWMVFLAAAHSIVVYGLGALILAGVVWWAVPLYLVYCLGIEASVLKRSCVHCYYYGKVCGLGRGRLCSWLFKQKERKDFNEMNVSWLSMLPDFLVPIIPLAAGVVLLIIDFEVLTLALLILLVVVDTLGNALVRGSLACKHCKQREIGCPAEKKFSRRE